MVGGSLRYLSEVEMRKLLLFLLLLIGPIMVVDASSIDAINMDIMVDLYGNAFVTETWDAYVTEGTEGWHPYYNLGNSEISDVSVKMDNQKFVTLDSWNEDSGLSEKAGKAGLYYPNSDEVDIVFGITSYGRHVYEISYKISNFVSAVEDADMIYWNLFPKDFSVEPGNVTIQIYSDFEYEDTLDVWGYGKYGAPCYVYDGKIEMTSDGVLDSDEYLTILVKFPKGTFQLVNSLENSFDYYYDMAENGAVNYQDKKSIWEFIVSILVFIFNILLFGLIFALVVNSSKNNKCSFGTVGNRVRKDVPNFRDIPCNKDIYRAYWVATNYNLIKKKEDFLGAVLLKWLRDGNIRVEKITKDGLFKDKVYNNIIFLKRPENAIDLDGKLYDYMYEASIDGKLESDEFKKWCDKNYTKIFQWFDDVIESVTKVLVQEGKAVYQEQKTMNLFKYYTYEIDASMMQEAEQMAGLKKFLQEFSRINEREAIEVSLWDEYLMYAQIFGIADEVASQFKKLYPEFISEMDDVGYSYSDIMFLHMITTDGIRSASSARSRAQSYNSGGGGFSSGGGGIGSFGGGGGGGGFR